MMTEHMATFLYLGRRWDPYRGKLTHNFYEYVDGRPYSGREELEERRLIYDDRPKSPIRALLRLKPGAIYEVTRVNDSSTRFSNPSPIGKWPNEEDRVYWDGLDWAAYLKSNEQKQLSKELDSALKSALEPVRQAYAKSVGNQRAHLLAKVVQIITGG